MSPQIPLGKYFFERMKQLDVNTIFGVPGDFNLALLDHIYEVEGMRWAGNANELNAAYAADGYSRIKGLSCLITTFGVGELSALNGVAGAFAEHVEIIVTSYFR
ncbi:magnesium ion binding protein [[Candida] boidinii]|nr:magnesium ion binding protein [[Candida] boidinii]